MPGERNLTATKLQLRLIFEARITRLHVGFSGYFSFNMSPIIDSACERFATSFSIVYIMKKLATLSFDVGCSFCGRGKYACGIFSAKITFAFGSCSNIPNRFSRFSRKSVSIAFSLCFCHFTFHENSRKLANRYGKSEVKTLYKLAENVVITSPDLFSH
jgi:amino acid permease